MKAIHKVLIGVGVSVVILAFVIVLPIVILDQTWWWLGITFFVELFVWAIIGLVFLLKSVRKKPLAQEKIDMKTAKARAIREVKYDEDNPDNFKINTSVIKRVGEGSEKTPIAWFRGTGTEMGDEINVLINISDAKMDALRIDNASEPDVEEVIRTFAENPAEKIIEERTQSVDKFGRPEETVKTTRSSSVKEQEKKDKEEAEKASAL